MEKYVIKIKGNNWKESTPFVRVAKKYVIETIYQAEQVLANVKANWGTKYSYKIEERVNEN